MNKIIIITAFFIAATISVKAQANLDSARSELYKVNKIFDSSTYIGFTVDILYYTDTSYGHFERQEKRVEYYLNNRNYYFKADEAEFIQTDSFIIDIDNAEKQLFVSRNMYTQPAGSKFALKEFLDSSIGIYASSYTIDIVTVNDSTQKISFATSDSTQLYKNFSIWYSPDSHYPVKMEIAMREKYYVPMPPNSIVQPVLEQKLEMRFSNYHGLLSSAIFDEQSYIYFDRATRRYEPTDKYKYYRFLHAGLEEEELPNNPQSLAEPAVNQ